MDCHRNSPPKIVGAGGGGKKEPTPFSENGKKEPTPFSENGKKEPTPFSENGKKEPTSLSDTVMPPPQEAVAKLTEFSFCRDKACLVRYRQTFW